MITVKIKDVPIIYATAPEKLYIKQMLANHIKPYRH